MAEIDYDKMKALFREANEQCNVKNCRKGDFHVSENTWGNVICVGCMIQGKNFGKPMVMPENFEMPSE